MTIFFPLSLLVGASYSSTFFFPLAHVAPPTLDLHSDGSKKNKLLVLASVEAKL